tara:strand:- start:250 stop:435 length:186 start_codon:yes stop_codon:yes gene_type:complete
MNKYLIILGLEALLEQVNNSKDLMYKSDYNKRVKEINEQINIMKELDINFSTFKKYEKICK